MFRMAVAEDKKIFQALLIEIIGTFTYVLIYMISTDNSTKLTQDDMLNSTVMAIGLGVSIIWGSAVSGGCYNPAVGLFLNLVKLFQTGKGDELKYVWIYIIFPIVGAFLSVIFHEFVFKNALEAKGEENEPKGEHIGANISGHKDHHSRFEAESSQSSFKPNPHHVPKEPSTERSEPLIRE